MDFVWEDPPTSVGRGNTGIWRRRLAPLKEHPSKWADFGPSSTSIAWAIAHGKMSGVAEGEFEVVTRTAESDGKPHLFVRYIGDDPSQ